MNLKKKLAMAMAVAAVCCSIGAPAVANAGEARACEHLDWIQVGTPSTSTYTTHHAYSVGDDEYKDCLITETKTTTSYRCGGCNKTKTETTTTQTHSACGR